MIILLAFIICCSASVSINSDKQVIVSKNEHITKIMVCSSLKHTRKTIDTSIGCSTPGFIQYAIVGNIAEHPHPERVLDDYYYAEIRVESNGEETMHVLRVPLEKNSDDHSMVFVGVLLGIIALSVVIVYFIKKRGNVKEYVTSDVFELK